MMVNEIVLNLHPVINLTGDEYYEFCRMNPDVKFEHMKLCPCNSATILICLQGCLGSGEYLKDSQVQY